MLYSSWTDIFSSKKEHSVKIIACFTIHCAVSKGRFQKYSNHLKNLSERIKKNSKNLQNFPPMSRFQNGFFIPVLIQK